MEILGIGTDIVLIDRVRSSLGSPSFLKATFTAAEIAAAKSRSDSSSYFAKIFSGKEAVFKCFGVDADSLRDWTEIEVLDGDAGQPVVGLWGSTAVAAAARGVARVSLSVCTTATMRWLSRLQSHGSLMRPEPFSGLFDAARRDPQRIVLPECADDSVLQAARQILDEGIGLPILVGAREELWQRASHAHLSLDGLSIVDLTEDGILAQLIDDCGTVLPAMSPGRVERKLRSPLNVGALLVATGRGDALVAGLAHTTAEVILASMTFLRMQEGIASPSSLFLMRVPGFAGAEGEFIVFADCGVSVEPEAAELADITVATSRTVRALLGWEPRVAMLSFSTQGSGEHASIERIRTALEMVRDREPALAVDGEFQVDTAIVPEVAARKVKGASPVAGRANVLIFPDLNAGNIAYKCVQRFARADAFGPLLQGFVGAVSDLSRGSSVADIVGAAALAGLHATGLRREDSAIEI